MNLFTKFFGGSTLLTRLNTSRHPDPARKEEGVTDCFVVDVHLNIRYTSISATREMESPIGHRNENRCSSWAVLHMTCTVNLVQSFGVTGECGRVTAGAQTSE